MLLCEQLVYSLKSFFFLQNLQGAPLKDSTKNFQRRKRRRRRHTSLRESHHILRVLYNWRVCALGRLWIPTLLIMSNTRCQSWMSDEQWEDGADECAMRGLFVFLAGELCQDSQPSNSVRERAVQQATCSSESAERSRPTLRLRVLSGSGVVWNTEKISVYFNNRMLQHFSADESFL